MNIKPREKDIIIVAIDKAIDAGLYKGYSNMLEEYGELKLKLKSRKSKCGNLLVDGFIMDSDGNQAPNEYQRLLDKGFRQLYYSAPYHWCLVNPETLQTASYCEGDTTKIFCKTKKKFIEEVKSTFKFFKDDYPEKASFWDISEKKMMKEINKLSPVKVDLLGAKEILAEA